MDKNQSTYQPVKEKLATMGWAIGRAWRIDKKMLCFWGIMSIALSVFPAISLYYNRNIISTLTGFITSGTGNFSDVVYNILMLGLILTVIGVSSRFNQDLLYMMMWDSYYLGTHEMLMEKKQRIDRTALLDKELNDEYEALLKRSGSLTDFISSSCIIISKVGSIISMLLVALTVSPVIAAISLVYILAAIIFNIVSIEKEAFDWAAIRVEERINAYYQGMPLNSGIAKEIRIYESGGDIGAQWEKSRDPIDKFARHRRFTIDFRALVSGVLFYLFIIGVLLYSIFSVKNGVMTVAVFLMIYTMGQNLSAAISGSIWSFMEASRGVLALVRQRRFILLGVEWHDAENPRGVDTGGEVAYEMKEVSFEYRPGKTALKNINLKIKKGETIALVGYNGSGKTTLTKLLIGVYPPTSGEILFYGHPVSDYAVDDMRRQAGVFFQDFYTFHGTVRENVGFGDVENIDDIEKIQESIKLGGAEKVVKKLPRGLDQWLNKGADPEGAVLSGGERQKIAVSRAHMCERDIMIFDEPAAALDPIAEMEQFLNIRKKIKGKTAILISHRIGFARLADRIIVMDKGEIVEDGTHDELMKRDGTYAFFFNEQAKWYTSEKEAQTNG